MSSCTRLHTRRGRHRGHRAPDGSWDRRRERRWWVTRSLRSRWSGQAALGVRACGISVAGVQGVWMTQILATSTPPSHLLALVLPERIARSMQVSYTPARPEVAD